MAPTERTPDETPVKEDDEREPLTPKERDDAEPLTDPPGRKHRKPAPSPMLLLGFLAGACLVVGVRGAAFVGAGESNPVQDFVVKPYLQLGNLPRMGRTDQRVLLWKMSLEDPGLGVEFRPVRGDWRPAPIRWTPVSIDPLPAYAFGSAMLA